MSACNCTVTFVGTRAQLGLASRNSGLGERKQQQGHPHKPGREPLDEFQQAVIRPLQILEHHQRGLLARESLEEPLGGGEQNLPVVHRVLRETGEDREIPRQLGRLVVAASSDAARLPSFSAATLAESVAKIPDASRMTCPNAQ